MCILLCAFALLLSIRVFLPIFEEEKEEREMHCYQQRLSPTNPRNRISRRRGSVRKSEETGSTNGGACVCVCARAGVCTRQKENANKSAKAKDRNAFL